ncbi:solute carrier family 36 (proton-coupled amino acid transporter) [Strigomonas culicis]|nr:solute carrier family 36 (proton-coupled amino acid transporter) [Strigomonas culicis]|eukprot:EPY29172.1 solute carrier family 36 (proton-coupled amino acid transporter) [Strigomonas culicis]
MIDCVSVLLRTKLAINHAEIKTYPAVVGFVLGDFFQQLTKFSLIFTQFGFCIMYFQYASAIFSSLFAGGAFYSFFVALSILLVTPMTFLSNRMDILAYASMVAGVFVGLVLCGTTAVDIQNLSQFGFGPDVFMCVPTARILVFLSGHMFSLEGIGIVLPVENSVAPNDRPRFRVVVKYTLTGVVILYIVFGVLGYMAYGAVLTNSVVQALPPSLIKNVMQCLLGLSLLFGYPIQFIPAIQLVDKSLDIQDGSTRANLMRVVLNIAFGVAAASIGQETINLFASFLGAFVGVHLMITLPALLALLGPAALDGERENYSSFHFLLLIFKPPYNVKKIKCYAYLLLALVVWVGGMYYTIRSVLTGT